MAALLLRDVDAKVARPLLSVCLKSNYRYNEVTIKHKSRFSLKFFYVIHEYVVEDNVAEFAPRVNRQITKATERNRIKRILREFFRTYPDIFNKGRWVFVAKPNVEKIPNREIFEDLEGLLKKIS